VTVYYKHGEWDILVYDTLREGLLEFVGRCESAAERKELLSLDDEGLLDRILIMGSNSDLYISYVADRYNCEPQVKKILIYSVSRSVL